MMNVSSGRPQYITPDAIPARPFGVWPHVGPVYVWARQRAALPIKTTDKLYVDGLLLQFDACWMYAVDDGTIPAQVNKFQTLAANRRRMLKASLAQHPIALDPRVAADSGAIEGVEDTTWFWLDKDPLA